MTPVVRLVRRIDRYDQDALSAWLARRTPAASRVMLAVTHLGDAAVVVGATLLLMLVGDGALDHAGRIAAFTLATSHAAVQLLKRTVGRPRPRLEPGTCLVAAPDRFSFPSGHAAAALSLALPLAALTGPAAVLVLGVGMLVGLSRCYLGVHYPGDVLIGWSLALTAYLIAPVALPLFGFGF